jgi:hypothetical protein
MDIKDSLPNAVATADDAMRIRPRTIGGVWTRYNRYIYVFLSTHMYDRPRVADCSAAILFSALLGCLHFH